ncbi:uncharacterized protein LOC124162787 [Ischnura elegans]|uniref:uncharacterized protein LOC124162787 n=1 Tax=Ischnura elegans TaxID=197161 RepID=UPI001ED89C39|nr:uncharacterized protein LOC124162787 [Ischnura elegans]
MSLSGKCRNACVNLLLCSVLAYSIAVLITTSVFLGEIQSNIVFVSGNTQAGESSDNGSGCERLQSAQLSGKILAPPAVMVCSSALSLPAVAFGMYVLWKKFRILWAFVLLLGILIFVELATTAWMFSANSQYRPSIEEILGKSFDALEPWEFDPSSKDATGSCSFWNDLQEKMDCCGVAGPLDYSYKIGILPSSCCKSANGQATRSKSANTSEDSWFCADNTVVRHVGCADALARYIEERLYPLGFFEVIDILLKVFMVSMCLFLSLSRKLEGRHLLFMSSS